MEHHELDPVFRPRTIAVIGASRTPGSVGHQVLKNIVEGGFSGSVFPVNPRADAVHAIKCYPDVAALPDPIDLGVVCVPAPLVLDVARACGERA